MTLTALLLDVHGVGNWWATTSVYQGEFGGGGEGVEWNFPGSCLDTRAFLAYNWWLSRNWRRLWRTSGMLSQIPVRCAGSHAVRERWRAGKTTLLLRFS